MATTTPSDVELIEVLGEWWVWSGVAWRGVAWRVACGVAWCDAGQACMGKESIHLWPWDTALLLPTHPCPSQHTPTPTHTFLPRH